MSVPNTSSALPTGLWLGAAYHPEDWPEERWMDDIRLMREAGLNVVRLGEGAWPVLEPEPGKYEFGWLDRVVAQLGEAQISTVLAVPTGAPPVWLLPQVLASSAVNGPEGAPGPDANRGWCIDSPAFQEAARQFVGALAEHFGPNPHVIGWEIDPGHDVVGQPACRDNSGIDFRPMRLKTQDRWQHQECQLTLLRPHLRPGVWITRAFSGWTPDCDPYILAEGLDFVSSECFIGSARQDFRESAALNDLGRGLKRCNFWMTSAPRSSLAKAKTPSTPHKDETQAFAWQAVAHGADGVLCWQWRPEPSATETCRHNTLLDQSGQPRPLFDEIKLLGLEFSALSTWLAGSTTGKARVAILNSPEAQWSGESEREGGSFDYVEHLHHWYRPLAVRNVPVDILPPEANLDQYKMVIAPALSVLNDRIVTSLQGLVKHSGHLVLTLRTGIRDEHGALLALRQPGPLSAIAGVEVEDYYRLDEPVPVKGNWFDGVSRHWAERLRIMDPNKAVKIARYGQGNGWLDNEIAITVCAHGTGLTYMVGAYLDVAAQQAMVDHFLQNAGMQKVDTPSDVELCIRVRPGGEQMYMVVNHGRTAATVTLPTPAENPLTGQPVTGPFRLAPQGVAVLVKAQTPPPSTPT